MCRCMTVWPAAAPVFMMQRKPESLTPSEVATASAASVMDFRTSAGTPSTMLA